MSSLSRLDSSYQNASHGMNAYYFSKLAILETCGWIETSMDDIVIRHCNRKIRRNENTAYVERQVVRRTYGFEYDQHFRSMLIRLVGIITTEKIEDSLNFSVVALFKAELTSLKTIRDSLAHTYAKSIPPIDAPSRTIARFQPLY